MKTLLVCLSLTCLFGCGRGDSGRTRLRSAYPPLHESSDPPPPDDDVTGHGDAILDLTPAEVPTEVSEDSGLYREVEKMETLSRMRDAARAEPDNPFVLTDQEIEALSRLNELYLH